MSASDDTQGGVGRREVAYRLFATEFDDAEIQHSDSDEERAPNYVITPTGARVNRLFVVGVLTEIEWVSDDVLRARIVDPTGAFVSYAGQYQPDAQTFLERAETPSFVAVTGKARTYQPDDSDAVFTSIRPESITEVDAETRDRWTVQAAAHTLDRIAAIGDAINRPEEGRALTDALLKDGVDYGLAAGIPLALEHYGTTTAYLDGLADVAIDAIRVVAGQVEEVRQFDLAPDEGGHADLQIEAPGAVTPAAGSAAKRTGESTGTARDTGSSQSGSESTTDGAEPAVDTDAGTVQTAEAQPGGGSRASGTEGEDSAEGTPTDVEATEASEAAVEESVDVAPEPDAGIGESSPAPTAGPDESETAATASVDEDGDTLGDFDAGDDESVATDELYELDEEERREVEEEFGTEFESGTEVASPEKPERSDSSVESEEASASTAAERQEDGGEQADADPASATTEATDTTPDPDGEQAAEAAPAGDEGGEADPAVGASELGEGPADDDEADDEGEVDVEAAVMDAMGDLDEGDGADREAVIEAVTSESGVDREAVEDAINDALMSGQCYEPEDGRLKAI